TQADLEATQEGVYDFVSHSTKNKDGDEEQDPGFKDGNVAALIRSSPELAKMFREKDMHLDAIQSPGRFSHLVLGIGSDPNPDAGAHKMYFDPQARGHKGPDGTLELDSQLTFGKKAREDYAAVTVDEIDATGDGVHAKPGGAVEGNQER